MQRWVSHLPLNYSSIHKPQNVSDNSELKCALRPFSGKSSQFCYCLLGVGVLNSMQNSVNDTVSWWRHQMEKFPRYWPFVRGIHRSPVNSQHKGQWRGTFMFSLICVWINGWENNREAGDLRRYRAHCDVIVMWFPHWEPADEETIQLSVIWDAITLMRSHCNEWIPSSSHDKWIDVWSLEYRTTSIKYAVTSLNKFALH